MLISTESLHADSLGAKSPQAYTAYASPFVFANSYRVLLAANDVSLKQAVNKIRSETGGRILSARETGGGNKTVYLIKVLMPNGQVRTFRIGATTGDIQ